VLYCWIRREGRERRKAVRCQVSPSRNSQDRVEDRVVQGRKGREGRQGRKRTIISPKSGGRSK
jgi:hypothetical protein